MKSGINLLLAVAVTAVTVVSCKKKDEETKTTTSSYKNQDLKGVINDLPWEYALGGVNSSEDFSDSTKFSHFFSILDTAQDDSCFASNGNRSMILFSISDANPVLAKGSHTLKLDLANWENSKTVTFVFYEAGNPTPQNYVATTGVYEILSVDTTTQIVTGRINAKYDSHHSVNGNFTVKYCFW